LRTFKYLLALACVAVLTACATNQFSKTQVASEGITLRNSRVFVYSFLDVRDVEFGPNMLLEFDRQLVQAFQNSDTTSTFMRFRDSDIGKYFVLTNSTVRVPTKEIIERNAERERTLGTEYRLIIFPVKLTRAGAWVHYDVRWELVNAKTGLAVWSTTSQGRHLNAWKNDEEPVARAKTIVDGIITEMRNSKLF
jgi:hypothetical protein